MVKAIIFDFFGVLCSDEFWRQMNADDTVYAVIKEHTAKMNIGVMNWKDYIEKLSAETKQDASYITRMFETEKINPELALYIDTLHRKYKTALLSNAHHDFIDPLLKRSNIENLFDIVKVSSRLGYTKPNPAVYLETLADLQVKPEEAVFIDDLALHTDAAKSLGISAITYQNIEQMKRELEPLLADTNHETLT